MSGEGYDVFIAYPGPHATRAEALRDALVEAVRRVFLDVIEVLPGDPWDERIENALNARALTAVLVGSGDPKNRDDKEEIARAVADAPGGPRQPSVQFRCRRRCGRSLA